MSGAKLPAPVAAVLGRREPVVTFAAPTAETIGKALAAAVEAGRDPTADPVVQRLVTARTLASMNLDVELDRGAQHRIGELLAEHAEQIVKAFRVALKADVKAVVDAKAVLGVRQPEDVTLMRDPSPDLAEAWAASKVSVRRIDAAADCWWSLAGLAGWTLSPYRRALVYGGVSLAQYRTLPQQPNAWQLVDAGATLEPLPSPAEWQERNRLLDAEIARADAAAASADRQRMKLASGGFIVG